MEKKCFTITDIINCGNSYSNPIKIFTLYPSSKDEKNIAFKPGQFVQLFQLQDQEGQNQRDRDQRNQNKKDLDEGFGKLSRPYSIASSPHDKKLRFVIKMVGGQFTLLLDKMRVGEKLGVVGPFGHFIYQEERDVIFLAAGTGIAPILGILEYIAQEKKQGNFTLFYSNKKQEEIACAALLENFKRQNPHIKIIYTLTQQIPDGWTDELGRIDEKMIEKYVDYANIAAVFICGPMKFAMSMKEIMVKLGTRNEKIKIEAWG
ncbi:MAG: FAD-dependent oxidoreductase [Candidatus Micrarchaeota archaeon]